MKMFYRYLHADHEHKITQQTDSSFLFLIQHSALLSLKETGLLTQMQYHHAEEALLQQCQKTGKLISRGFCQND